MIFVLSIHVPSLPRSSSWTTAGDGAAEAARRHPLRPAVVRMPRHGPGATRNVGVFLASGDTVVFADADTLLPPRGPADIAAALAMAWS